jgi:hypothetical protein
MALFLLRQDINGPDLDAYELARRNQLSEQAMWIQLFDHKLDPPQGMAVQSR